MKEILQAIYQAQNLDNQIKICQDRLNQIPIDLARFTEELESSRFHLDEVIKKQNESSKKKKSLEQEMEQTNTNIKKHQTQLLSVKTNKEYSTMLHEIDGEKQKVSAIEENILLEMELVDKLASQEAEERKVFKGSENSHTDKQLVLEKEASDVKDRVERLKKEKQDALVKLPKDVMALYDRIGKARNGVAAVAIKNGACGGCYGNLPTQLLNRVRDMDKITTCENCGRILIWQGSNLTQEKQVNN